MREFSVIFFSTWKFAATFPVAIYAMKMSFRETLIYTNAGGIIGVIFFLYFSQYLIRLWNIFRRKFRRRKLLFTPATRRFLRIKKKYGLLGIVILSPVILSIPVGAFLAAKYYGVKLRICLALIAGQFLWSLVFTIFYTQVKAILV
jgi:hypothetical protein